MIVVHYSLPGRLSIVHKARFKATEQDKTAGRWIQDAIKEKIEREEKICGKWSEGMCRCTFEPFFY